MTIKTTEVVNGKQAKTNESHFECDFLPGHVLVGIEPSSQISCSKLDCQFFPELNLTNVEILLSANTETLSIKAKEAIGSILLLELVDGNKEAVLEAIERLEQNPHVAYAEPDYIQDKDQLLEADQQLTFTQNANSLLWNMERIGLANAWAKTTGDSEIKVGILDSGIDHTHPNLAKNVDPSLGWNFAQKSSDTSDQESGGHGTIAAGIIGATGHNNYRMVGMNSEVTLIPLKIRNDETGIYSAAHVRALKYANEIGIHIINRSLGSDKHSKALENAIRSFNGLIINSAGNNARDTDLEPRYPASLNIPNMITVGNSNQFDQKSRNSNFGLTTVDLFAPGHAILSTAPGRAFRSTGGTSFAAPHVTGAAVLALSVNPSFTPVELKAAIMNTVDPVPALADLSVTGGRLNVGRLVTSAFLMANK